MISLTGLILLIGLTCVNGQVYTTSGEKCQLPFIYQSRTYYSCITLNNNNTPWCSLTDNYDRDRRFGTCDNVRDTYSGPQCYTPTWRYLGNEFSGCTTMFIGVPWCGTKAEVPASFSVGSWAYCKPTGSELTPAPPASLPAACDVKTTSGTAIEGSSCIFPFTYKDTTYRSCTGIESKGAWCAITSNYQGGWGYCVYQRSTIPSSNGNNCVFPFKYRGQLYNHCITLNNNFVPWCATTADYDANQQWGNCNLPTCTATVG